LYFVILELAISDVIVSAVKWDKSKKNHMYARDKSDYTHRAFFSYYQSMSNINFDISYKHICKKTVRFSLIHYILRCFTVLIQLKEQKKNNVWPYQYQN
jgi:hypothetical protein